LHLQSRVHAWHTKTPTADAALAAQPTEKGGLDALRSEPARQKLSCPISKAPAMRVIRQQLEQDAFADPKSSAKNLFEQKALVYVSRSNDAG
jgi:hypothetical protein